MRQRAHLYGPRAVIPLPDRSQLPCSPPRENMVTGFGPEAGSPLLGHKDVRVVSFTGSTEVGREVGKSTAGSFKHIGLEMGGKNAILVMDDADLELAVD